MNDTPKSQQSALVHVERERIRLLATRQKQLDAFVSHVSEGKRRRLSQLYAKVRQTGDFLRTLEEIGASLTPLPDSELSSRRRYLISSLFLYESFRKLTADRFEQFFFVTGAEVGNALILDQWAEFEHQKRTEMGVTGDHQSTNKALLRLEQFGHRLHATFHSHPGNGPGMTRPSGIDINFQTRLESAGHRAVMAIFSRDGFIRFLRQDHTPEIEIFGTGVEKHDTDNSIYHLTDIYNL